jgi:hypothetical protein
MSQNESAIEQINLGYNDQQDRLLLKLGLADKSEIALWITRSIYKVMAALLQSSRPTAAVSPASVALPALVPLDSKTEALASFAQEAAEQQALGQLDFKSAYLSERQAHTAEPLLAVKCVLVDAESQQPQLELHSQHGQIVRMALTSELLQAVTSMMQLAIRDAGWDVVNSADNQQISLMSPHQVLH